MGSQDHVVQERMELFARTCKERGIKLTHQRMEIFREVAQSTNHPDAEMVFKGIRKRLPTVSLDTVYRTLWLLTNLGLIQTLGISKERTRFDANLGRHHHFVCTRCGKTLDFNSPEYNDLVLPEQVADLGRIESTHVEARGVCHDCLQINSLNDLTNGKEFCDEHKKNRPIAQVHR